MAWTSQWQERFRKVYPGIERYNMERKINVIKQLLSLIIILGFGQTLSAQDDFKPLFNGKDIQVMNELPDEPEPVEPIVWKADSTSEFEVGTQIRAWEIRDEGMGYILDNMQQMAGINNVYMVVVMHAEHRPFQAPEFPHNPARDSWEAEDSRVTFFPDTNRYKTVKPLMSDTAWIRETDWLQLMIDSCRERGLAVGAEVSHYPIPKSIIGAKTDWQQKKIDGESGSTSLFCPNNPRTKGICD